MRNYLLSAKIQSVMALGKADRSVSRILIADDDPLLRDPLTAKLLASGLRVTTAESGAEALRMLRAYAFRILVLDLDMRNSDGFSVLKAAKRNHPGVHVVAVTGYMQGALLEAAECLGAAVSLRRSAAPRQILKTVRRLLGEPE